jgi:DNA-binding response OmpR family regulator
MRYKRRTKTETADTELGKINPVHRRRKIVGIAGRDLHLLRILKRHLTRDGYKTVEFHAPEYALDSVLTHGVDALLLDIGLPHCDCMEFSHFVRRLSSIPLILLAGRDDVETPMAALDAGADDYLVKPFDMRELSARLRVGFRRRAENPPRDASRTASWRVGDSRLLLRGYQLVRDDARCARLTAREFSIFVRLLEQLGTPVTREELQVHSTGEDAHPNDRRIDVHIARIRKKLSAIGEHGVVIRCIRSLGYVAEGLAESMPVTMGS